MPIKAEVERAPGTGTGQTLIVKAREFTHPVASAAVKVMAEPAPLPPATVIPIEL